MNSILRFIVVGAVASMVFVGCSKDVEKSNEKQSNLTQKYDDTELRSLISAVDNRVKAVETRSLENLNEISDLRAKNQQNADMIAALESQVKDLAGVVLNQKKLIEENTKRNSEQDLQIANVEKRLSSQIKLVAEEALKRFAGVDAVLNELVKRIQAIETSGGAVLAKVEKRLEKVEVKTSRMKMARIDGFPSVVFDAVNVHIRNGAKHTTTINGLGNLVIGYGERVQDLKPAQASSDAVAEDVEIQTMDQLAGVDLKSVDAAGTDLIRFNRNRVGSHNLVVGPFNEYTSYGAVINGVYNRMRAPFASILGGGFHVNEGIGSVIGGGFNLKTDIDLQFIAESYKWPKGEPAPVAPVRVHPIMDVMPTDIRDTFRRAAPQMGDVESESVDRELARE